MALDNLHRSNFIWDMIDQDIENGNISGKVQTRFPPEPNGYLHIGHCRAMCADFETAQRYGGKCFLRFDDTNPVKEDIEYVEAIIEDIEWLGYKYDELRYGSDYFDQCYQYALELIRRGLAYVDELTKEQMREYRGTLTTPGKNSPWRDRPIEESLDLFERMKNGEFDEGSIVLRAKIDMASPNMNMRDPTIYRILKRTHHQTGDKWCIYPMYDYAHPLQDALEGTTHSLCSFEYEDHRPLYDWCKEIVGLEHPPRQIEFARLNITRTVMSKRYLRAMVEQGLVTGWDDPRMPTLVAMRRRGYTPDSVKNFIFRTGLSKAVSVVDFNFLEHCVREDLGSVAPRVMAVLNPLKITLTNWQEGKTDSLMIENHPDRPDLGEREVLFGKEIYIEREDFMENPPKKFFRLFPGGEVRLKGAYIIKCDEVIKDENGEITQLLCTVDESSRSGSPGSMRKVKGTLHWVNAATAVSAEMRLYEPLLAEEEQGVADDELEDVESAARVTLDFNINPNSLSIIRGAMCEPLLEDAQAGATYQFLRQGYFCKDKDSTPGHPVFNRTVSLKDSWAKQAKQDKQAEKPGAKNTSGK